MNWLHEWEHLFYLTTHDFVVLSFPRFQLASHVTHHDKFIFFSLPRPPVVVVVVVFWGFFMIGS
jgi:hypothetical protein